MNWHPCNCPGGFRCEIADDDFEREELGGGWSEEEGSWEIASGALVTGDADARLEFGTAHPEALVSHIVEVRVKADTAGDCTRIWLADDLFVELECVADGCGYLRLYDETGELAETRVEGATLDTWHSLRGCYHEGDGLDAERFVGRFKPGSAGHEHQIFTLDRLPLNTASGLHVGLATGHVAGTAAFDDFSYEIHRHEGRAHCKHCRECEIWTPAMIPGNASEAWEQHGTWSADGTSPLIAAAESDGLAVSRVTHSRDAANGILRCNLRSPIYGRVARAYWPFGESAADSVYVEVRFSTSIGGVNWLDDGYIRFYDGNTLLGERPNALIRDIVAVEICLREIAGGGYAAHFHAQSDLVTRRGAYAVTHASGRRIAFSATPSMSPFSVGGLSWYRSRGPRDPTCEGCLSAECTICPEGDALVPPTWTVEIDGFKAAPCADCAEMNASHVVAYLGQACIWSKTTWTCGEGYGYASGDEGSLELAVRSGPPGFYVIEVTWTQNMTGCYYTWNKQVPDDTECRSVDDLLLDYDAANSFHGGVDCCEPLTGNTGDVTCRVTAN